MKFALSLLSVWILLLGLGCSSQSVKKTVYESIESMRQIECQKDLSTDCQERQSHEDYQRKKQE